MQHYKVSGRHFRRNSLGPRVWCRLLRHGFESKEEKLINWIIKI